MKVIKTLPIVLVLILLPGVNSKSSQALNLRQKYFEAPFIPSKNNKPAYHWEEINVEATAYCSCKYCTGWGKNITASGVTPSRGTIAAPKNIPFGTIIKLDGLGEYIVQDRGGGIKVKKGVVLVDVWMPSHLEALKFGRKKLIGWIKVEQR